MRNWIKLTILLSLATLSAPSDARRHYHRTSPTLTNTASSSDYYTAVSGHRVHRPVSAHSAPAGASAQCRDSSWSFSENHRGTCSHHGGVARWL
ncbi:MAG: hypothetical protein JWR80_4235 [Bradyrhizobium sp.]|nr:hypothetical protein [Bradyrhizobium sp.]